MEAEVLEQAHLAAAKIEDDLLRRVADAVVGHVHFASEELGEARAARLERKLRIGPFFGRPRWLARIDARAALERVLDRRQRLADARVVGDRARPVERHVEVDADEDALVLDRQIANRSDARRA